MRWRSLLRRALGRRLGRYDWVCHQVVARAQGTVLSGPFAGMRYVPESTGSEYYCKLLGTYERELGPIVSGFPPAAFDLIVNVGAAEGYYAVGLARRIPQARVVAFETDERGRDLMTSMAAMNGVADRLTIRGFCDAGALNEALEGGREALVIMDIEGGESILLDPQIVPALANASVLVELHTFAIHEVDAVIRRRFERSHRIVQIHAQPRRWEDLPLPVGALERRLLGRAWLRTMDEGRPPGMSWFWMTPRTAQSSRLV